MNSGEWTQVLNERALMWPAAKKWSVESAKWGYQQLRGYDGQEVLRAMWNLRGEFPPSPAHLAKEVARLEAASYKPPALPEPETPFWLGAVDRWLEKEGAVSGREVFERLIADK